MPDLERLEATARTRLPADVAAYYAAGAGRGRTLEEQERAWSALRLKPRVLTDVSNVSIATELLGTTVSSPIGVAPTALHGLAHASGEVATATACAATQSLFVLSMRSSLRMEDVAAAGATTWQQIYVLRDRGISDEIARRAGDAGARALVVTVDTPVVGSKPASIPAGAMRTGLVPELDERDADDTRLWQASDLVPSDLERLAAVSGLPVVAKGVLRGDQARRCVEAGAQAVIVSTHGGRQLDSVISVPRALPEVTAEVGGEVEVYADGGIRHGIDVVAALGLGARAVFLGRPILWALAVGGAEQVALTLSEFQAELGEALALAGCASVAEVGADVVESQSR